MIPTRWAHLPAAQACLRARDTSERATATLTRLQRATARVSQHATVDTAAPYRAHTAAVLAAMAEVLEAVQVQRQAEQALILACVRRCIDRPDRVVTCHGRDVSMTPRDHERASELIQVLCFCEVSLYVHADARGALYCVS